MPLRVGLIGCGSIGTVIARAIDQGRVGDVKPLPRKHTILSNTRLRTKLISQILAKISFSMKSFKFRIVNVAASISLAAGLDLYAIARPSLSI